MKNFITIILTLFIAVAFVNNTIAQFSIVPIPNPSFEDWGDEGNYYDPSPDAVTAGGFWDTGNKVEDLATILFEPNATQDSDAYEGNSSIRLETTSVFGLLASGTVYSGKFIPNTDTPLESAVFGQPFTETPDYFRVWYQYESVQGDSAEVYCYLGKGTDENTRIASAYTKIYNTTSGWTELLLPFEYTSSETPDTIVMVFASSAAGDDFEGQVGSTLYIDDINLIKCDNPGTECVTVPNENLISESLITNVFPNPSLGEVIQFGFSKRTDGVLNIFSVDGKKVFSTEINEDSYELNVAKWNSGLYQYVINDKDSDEAISRGTFIIQ